ncbi:MAG: hypothetical protein AAFN79_12025 [Pseudomonadota bacterium]
MSGVSGRASTLREAIFGWCADDTTVHVAIVAGFTSDEFSRALVGPLAKRIGLLTTPRLANAVSLAANEMSLPAPVMRNAARLDIEFAKYNKQGSSKIIALPFDVTGTFVMHEVRRLARQQSILFDVPPNEDRLLKHIVTALRKQIEFMCHNSGARMIAHDPIGDVLVGPDTAADLIVTAGFDAEPKKDVLKAKVEGEAWTPDVESALSIMAREVIAADRDGLRMSIRFSTFADVRKLIWKDWIEDMSKLAANAEDDERRDIAELAKERLLDLMSDGSTSMTDL